MRLKKGGMELMKDTGSLTNALIENHTDNVRVGMTFAELLWTDRTLWIVTEVINPRKFKAERVETKMEDWTDGTEYPVKDENGNYKTDGQPCVFSRPRKYWRHSNSRVHLAFGETTGYRDPSF